MDQKPISQDGRTYDLGVRTVRFSEDLIDLCKSVKLDEISRPIVSQLIRSGTSVGANYAEANNASSKKDFRNKIFISKKEAEETKYWLRLLQKITPNNANLEKLTRECQQLLMIFQKIVSSLKN